MNEQLLNSVLVQEIEKRPVIYNYKLRRCCRKEEMETAWKEVGKAVEMTVPECKVRWKNIRTVFARHIKSKGTGFKKRPYYLYQAMQFAIPYIKVLNMEAETQGRREEKGGEMDEEREEEGKESFEDVHIKEELVPDLTDAVPEPGEMELGRLSPTVTSLPVTMPQESSNPKLSSECRRQKNFPIFNNKSTNRAAVRMDYSRRRALRMFLLSMLPDLESMTTDQVRVFKRKCLEVIEEVISEREPA